MRDFQHEALCHDPVHGYIPFTTGGDVAARGPDSAHHGAMVEVTERQLIDHPWLQRLRQIHQLQTAFWVFPTAEHSRFQHVLGAMHLASRAVATLYDSLREVCPDVPSQAYVEALMRMAALLHDVGHGPFGHFLDEHLLRHYDLTHETLGSEIIRRELAPLLRGIRRTPNGTLAAAETLDPEQICQLIVRPTAGDDLPRWLRFLRSLFSGLYTVDNMDFVLRDAYMSGYAAHAFDLDRLLRYSFFSASGLTIHARGLPALVRFLSVRAELFRVLYFHRTVRSIDLTLADLFADSREYLFAGNPRERLEEYRRFTDYSLLVDVARWPLSNDPRQRELGDRWQALLNRQLRWKLAAERTVFFDPARPETGSIFSRPDFFEQALRAQLPAALRELPLRVDVPRHMHRPGTRGPTAGQNFVYDPARDEVRPLDDSELVRQMPLGYRICRVYAETAEHRAPLAAALDALAGSGVIDDRTNM
ncbi:MAG: HD domain-containing protein [Planctomycetes bacterium]|nr:HD domain-containing protein [Planctomycetota bacterium]